MVATALHHAAKAGRAGQQDLIKSNPEWLKEVEAGNDGGNRVKTIKVLLQAHPALAAAPDKSGKTPAQRADQLRRGDWAEAVKQLDSSWFYKQPSGGIDEVKSHVWMVTGAGADRVLTFGQFRPKGDLTSARVAPRWPVSHVLHASLHLAATCHAEN